MKSYLKINFFSIIWLSFQVTPSIISPPLPCDPRYIVLGADLTENTVSIIIAQQYLDCCLLILRSGNVFNVSLRTNERPFWLRYYGFQASYHNVATIMISITGNIINTADKNYQTVICSPV
jgi:hypothetical protein